jgi:hypothetical protein
VSDPDAPPLNTRALLDAFERHRVSLEIGESTVLVAALQDIVRSKEIADRPPDHEALPELRRLRDDAIDSDADRR